MMFPKALSAFLLIGSISAQRVSRKTTSENEKKGRWLWFDFGSGENEDNEIDFPTFDENFGDIDFPTFDENFGDIDFPEIEFPEIEFPEIPEIELPEIPEIEFPEIPEIEFPEIPEIEFPEIPEIEFPEIPEIEFPEIPEIEFPEIPPCNSTVETVEDLDFATFSASRWYVHMQTEQPYKPVDTNFCVTWDYSSVEETAQGYTIEVKENLQLDDGKKFQNKLCAYEQESSSKLAAGPCEFPKLFAQPHWIIAYNEDLGYALVSSGQKVEEGEEEGCFSTSEEFAGLWVLTRSPVRDDSLIEGIILLAEEQGFDVSALNDVDHSDCGEEEECKDHEGVFGDKGPFWRRNKDCAWVAKRTSRRCFIVGDLCPETCDLC